MTEEEQPTPVAAVARYFSAPLQERGRALPAELTIDGKVIALRVLTFAPKRARGARATKPGLRFDRVALATMRRLRIALEHVVPADRTLVVTVTAPIRQAAKTAAALAQRLTTRLRRRSTGHSASSICGNKVQVWLLRGGSATTARLIGFVHNPDTDPAILAELARALLTVIAADRCRGTTSAAQRWLVIDNQAGLPIETYRNICQQLRLEVLFGQILMTQQGAVEKLACG